MTTPNPTGPVATWDDDALEALCRAVCPRPKQTAQEAEK